MLALNDNQKKNLGIVGILLILSLVWIFIYLPICNKMTHLKKELKRAQKDIQQIEREVSQNGSMEKGIQVLQAKYDELVNKFPAKEEEALKQVSDLARQKNLKITSTRPQKREAFVDANGKSVTIDGKNCQRVRVSVLLEGQFRDVVYCLTMLRKDFPVCVTIEKITIRKLKVEGLLVDVSLDMTIYLL